MGVIYKITNKLNDKIYIGQTTRTLEIRMKEHTKKSRATSNSYIDRAIQKYGIDAFDVSVIEECDDEEKLNEREKHWIKEFNSKFPNGYNLTEGGDGMSGYIVSEETRKNLSTSHKGKKLSEKTRALMSISNKNKRSVICLETNEKFDSIVVAAKHFGITAKSIGRALHGKTGLGSGYHWCYAEDAEKYSNVDISSLPKHKRSIRCVETSEIFESISAAAKWIDVNISTIIGAINKSTNTAGGYHWVDVNAEMDINSVMYPRDYLHAVKCVETGQVFRSMNAAAKWANVCCCSSIQRVLNQSARTAGGYHWVDVTTE